MRLYLRFYIKLSFQLHVTQTYYPIVNTYDIGYTTYLEITQDPIIIINKSS